LRALIDDQPAAALGTLHGGAPFVSMAPFAVTHDGACFAIHVSRLATHTQDMLQDARVSLMVMQRKSDGVLAQALPRVTIQGEATQALNGTEEWKACRTAYLQRFPEAAPLLDFGDFSFFAIRPNSARFVAGFARAMTIPAEALVEALRTA
jgi:putative heme iron utilization protein